MLCGALNVRDAALSSAADYLKFNLYCFALVLAAALLETSVDEADYFEFFIEMGVEGGSKGSTQ